MRGSQTYVPGVGLVPYVPGGRIYRSSHSVGNEDQTYGNPGADTPDCSQSVTTGWSDRPSLLALFGMLALAALIDLAAALLTVWWLFR